MSRKQLQPTLRLLRNALFLPLFLASLLIGNARATTLDHGIDPANLGKGDWIYYLSLATNHLGQGISSVTSLTTLMQYEKNQGVSYVIVKAGTGSTNFNGGWSYPQFTNAVITAAHNAGLKIFAYTRSYGSDVAGEIKLATNCIALGADGFVIDAETEWESGTLGTNGPSRAIQLCSGIKAVYPNTFLGHAPLPIISFHSSFPYKEFGYYCDAVMPQDYWQTGSLGALVSYSPSNMVARMDSEFSTWQNSLTGQWTNAIKPIVPIASGYNPSSTNITTGTQITEFFNALKGDTNPASSTGYKGMTFWQSYDHTTDMWNNGIAPNSIGGGPNVATQPAAKTIGVGTNAAFTVLAFGEKPLSYQWQFNNANILGATTSAYTRNSAQTGDAGNYTVIVTDTGGSTTSSVAVLTIQTKPAITAQPQGQSVTAGQAASFSTSATGSSLNYQWRKDGTAMSDGGNISGSTTSSLAISSAFSADAASYTVVITNYAGSITSSVAALTVTDPYISGQPASRTNNYGSTATFSVTAVGTSPFSYQWKRSGTNIVDGGNISGAATATLTITSVTDTDGTNYTVVVQNSVGGSATSSAASLTVIATPAIASEPVSRTNNAGTTATFTVSATGSVPLSYQWQKNGVSLSNGGNISGANSATLTITSVSQNDAANYSVVVTNSSGSATSSSAALTVIDPPAITTQPSSRTNNVGTTATFTVAASGTSPSYQWRKGGVALSNTGNVSGATSATLTLASVSSSDAANYTVVITNVAGSVTSVVAALTVNTPPSISTQPQSQTVAVGANVTFNVTAAGTAPLNYQWRFNGVNISGATGSAFTTNNVQVASGGSYSVVVTNVAGSITSGNATLKVIDSNQVQVVAISNIWNIAAGSRSYISTGSTERGIAINTVSNHVLVVSRAAVSAGAIYSLNATNGADLGITLNTPGSVITSAQFNLNKIAVTSDGIVYAANLTTGSSTNAFRIYRWVNYSDTPVVAYSGAPDGGTTARWGDTFAVRGTGTNTQIIVSTSGAGLVALFTTTDGTNFTPTILTPSPSLGASAFAKGLSFGDAGTFYAKNRTATTATNFSYTIGASTPSVNATLPNLDSNVIAIGYDSTHKLLAGITDDNTTNNASHTLKFYDISTPSSPVLTNSFTYPAIGAGTNSSNSNFAGAVDSDGNLIVGLDTQNGIVAAQVYVLTSPAIASQPNDSTNIVGQTATFSVAVSGSTPLSYQWLKNGQALSNGGNISGVTSSTLTIANIASSDAADYTVTITNLIGSVTSAPGTLTILVPATISSQPVAQTNNAGATASFSVVASGSAPISYVWNKNGQPLSDGGNVFSSGTTNLTLVNVSQSDAADYSVTVYNAAGTNTSSAVHLTIIDPPTIAAQPSARTNNAGTTATFTVSANGATPSFQWKKNGLTLTNGGNISGATTATLSIAGVTQSDAADYTVTVSNSAGSVNSSAAHLTVIDTPAITAQPASQTNNAGANVTFSVVASGQSLTYQWNKDGSPISGATASVLALNSISQANAADYTVVVTNSAGSVTSSAAHLTVIDPPGITSQPTSRTNIAGTTATFSVSVSSLASVTYQWSKGGVAINDGGNISGAKTATLQITTVSHSDEGNYSVLISNSAGSTNSATAHLTVVDVPVIVTQPLAQAIGVGSNAVFSVTATGAAPLTYQWKKNGNNVADGGNISGAQTSSLTISAAGYADSGTYTVVISNSAGNTTSTGADLNVIDPPTLTTQPQDQTNSVGDTASFYVAASGANLRYQWQKEGTNLVDDLSDSGKVSGALTSTLLLNSVVNTDVGNYSVIISNEAGSVTSIVATLTVIPLPTITAQPFSQTNILGATVSFTVSATGVGPLSYQWMKGGVAISDGGNVSGASTSTLQLANVGAADVAQYSVAILNETGGQTVSATASLTVILPPTIVTQPQNHTNASAATATFSVAVTGTSPFSYQWFKNGNPLSNTTKITGATTALLKLAGTTSLDISDYSVVVSNAAGSATSIVAHLEVLALPVITGQPVGSTNLAGTTATFTVNAVGTGLSYQWKKAGIALSDYDNVSGTHSSTLVVANVLPGDAASYTVVVSNLAGFVTSRPALLTVRTSPTIVSQPLSRTNNAGTTATFAVVVSGSTPLTYQWYKEGIPLSNGGGIAGATAPTLVLTGVSQSFAGNYSVTVTNLAGTASSSSATLTVIDGPQITTQPASITNITGSTATFTVVANGTSPSYQWRCGTTNLVDGGRISGATSASLQISGLQFSDAAGYSVIVSNAAGKQISATATLGVVGAPIILTQPAEQDVFYNANASFSVKVSGTGPFTYQWFKGAAALANSTKYAGVTTSNLTVLGSVNADEGNYSVTVSNAYGGLTSASAPLLIVPGVTIVQPKASATLSNSVVTITGTASDHVGITSVMYQINGGPFQTASGTTNWSAANVPLAAGTNVIGVKSINTASRASKIATRSVFFAVPGTLTVVTNGVGGITPANLLSIPLYVGRNYNIIAVPGTGQLFSNWTGTYTSTNQSFTFMMQTNVTLNVNLVTNLFIPRAGTYSGLFYETNEVRHESSGYFNFTLLTSGKFSGKYYLAGIAHGLAGQFSITGKSQVVLAGTSPVTLNFDLDLASGISDHVIGSVSNVAWNADLLGYHLVYNSNNIAPQAGKYLVAFTNASDGINGAGGDGTGTVTVSTNGTILLAGTLPEASLLSQSTTISKDGYWPLYVALYAGKGSILGWLDFTNRTTSSIEGNVSWIKKEGSSSTLYYSTGFTNDLFAIGSTFIVPTSATRMMSWTNGIALLSGADLPLWITNTITLSANNVITVDPGQPNGLSLTLNTNNGQLTGTFADRAAGIKVLIKGVLLQQQNTARGSFSSLPNHKTGSFSLQGN